MVKKSKKGKKNRKFEEANSTPNPIKSKNTDSTSVEHSATVTSDVLDSSYISRISDNTKDESTDASTRLDETTLDEQTGKDSKQNSSDSYGTETNCKNYESENVKTGMHNLSVNSAPIDDLHKNNVAFENREKYSQHKSNRKGFRNEKQTGGKGTHKRQDLLNVQQEMGGRNVTGIGESQGELQDNSQQNPWSGSQKPQEQPLHNSNAINRSYENKYSNTRRFNNRNDRRERRDFYKDKGSHDGSVGTYKVENSKNVWTSEENWDKEIEDKNSNNYQDFARENSLQNSSLGIGESQGEFQYDSRQKPSSRSCGRSQKPQEQPLRDYSNAINKSNENKYSNIGRFNNRNVRRNESTNQRDFYKNKGGAQDGSVSTYKVENSENIWMEEENWDKEIKDKNSNNQDSAQENSCLASNKWDDENTENVSVENMSSDYYEDKVPQKSKAANGNWRQESNRSFPTMSTHRDHSKRYSEGYKDYSYRGGSKNWYSESSDKEFRAFQDEERNNQRVEFVKVKEIQQDLFAMPKDYSLGHCVAEDMRMGSGIAVNFKRDFKQVGELLDQRQKQGGLAVIEDESKEGTRYIYYLVTKRESTGKPTYEKFWSSLQTMRDHIRDNNVKKLAIPRLGCGLDRLEWDRVKHMIEFLFREVDAKITVCNFQQTEESLEKQQNYTCKVVNVAKSIAAIEEYTTIIYLSSVDGHVSEEMKELDKKFCFLKDFKNSGKQLGDLIKFQCRNQEFILYGCIVRKSNKDLFQFGSFAKCVSQINRNNRKDKYEYIGIQAIKDDHDDLLMEKMLTILKNYLVKVHIYVCWHGDLVRLMPISYRESL